MNWKQDVTFGASGLQHAAERGYVQENIPVLEFLTRPDASESEWELAHSILFGKKPTDEFVCPDCGRIGTESGQCAECYHLSIL